MASSFRSSNTPGHGTASAMGMQPIDIVTKWCNQNLRDSDIQNLPCEEIYLNDETKIKCLVSDKTNCSFTMLNALNRSNVIEMFEHLYKHHSAWYADITANFDRWRQEKVKSLPSSSSVSTLPDEILTNEEAAEFLEKRSAKKAKTTTAIDVSISPPVQNVQQGLQYQQKLLNHFNKSHDKINSYLVGSISQDQLLADLQALANDYLQQIGQI